MFKTVLTLFRGSVAAAGEELEDRSALLILDQQMRDAAAAVERSKRTLALAIAQDQQEGRRLDATNARIADLEIRATAALDGGREDLAREAAAGDRQSRGRPRCRDDRADPVRFGNHAAEASGRRRRGAHHRTRSRPPHRPRLGSGSRHAPRRRRSRASLRIHAAGSGEHAEAPARTADRSPGRRRGLDRNRCRQRTAGDRRKARRTGLWTTTEINRGRRARAAERQTHASQPETEPDQLNSSSHRRLS